MQSKKQTLYLILCLIFLINAVLAEIIGVKIFSLEKYIGIDPFQFQLPFNFILDFNLTAGVVIWPVVFITSDIINEYFGKKGLKFISFLTAGLILYSFLIIYFSTTLPPADFWIAVNKQSNDSSFNINSAFSMIFRQGLGIITGSLVAFLIGQIIDTHTFHYLKSISGSKNLWLRSTGSTIVSQFIDSFVVLGIAFYVFGNWTWQQVIAVGLINYFYKFLIAVLLTPVLYLAHNVIDKYLATDQKESTDKSIGGGEYSV